MAGPGASATAVVVRAAVIATLCAGILAGCMTAPRQAPIQSRTPAPEKRAALTPNASNASKGPNVSNAGAARAEVHSVKKGETLYSIALEAGLDYKELAQWNNLDNPKVIRPGQQLRLTPPAGAASVAQGSGVIVTALKESGDDPTDPPTTSQENVAANAPNSAKVEGKPVDSAALADQEQLDWAWPTSGKARPAYSEQSKGVDFQGSLGQPVFSSAAGKVVYTGSNLRGYGKLIIIKHNKTFLSAYAHNSQILVQEGQLVQKGQKIAEMGNSGTDQVKLHFEIRRFGKPVDPAQYLPNDKLS